MAIGALEANDATFDAIHYQNKLRALGHRRKRALFYEAMIALCVLRRTQPSKTVRRLANLREIRETRGEMAQFESFTTLIEDHLAPLQLTNHGYRRHTLADLDHGPIWERVHAHISVLADLGYEVFLNSGTLLGVTRDKRLIDHDDDVDFALILRARSPKGAAREWRDLREKLRIAGIFDEENYKGASIYKLTPVEGIQIDLFPAWFENGRAFIYPHSFGDLAREDVLPLQPCAVTGQPIPANPEKMLVGNYGENWQTPDPLFKFPWRRAHQQFADFLEEFE
ncbi:hypothetical protein KDD17_12220 [Sulfitobacter albidus]|uniref:LicD family protein n=1 Tax=Sulfitobacter albidus TaxID=2829501 RepID=A0A975JCG3_9RHOB|nr:hypothetical protein [Sulfitobacter albidus]QUJ75715.1 hypothetical protein KDD17_12220 [Sulfitobacter albidus]